MTDNVLESLGIYSPEDGAMRFSDAVSEMQDRGEMASWEQKQMRPMGDTSFLVPAPRSSQAEFSYTSSGESLDLLYAVRPQVIVENNFPAPLDAAKRLNSDLDGFRVSVDLRYMSGSEPMFE